MGLRRSDTQRPSVPSTVAVFAIGDLHGEVDLLVQMHQQILKQAKELPANLRKIVIYLGDYIDLGRDSAGVIDTLVSAPLPGFKSIYLLGNHELAFISFLKGEANYLQNVAWIYKNGGIKTLESYGVHTFSDPTPKNIAAMRIQLLRKIPTDHFSFLEQLQLNYTVGDFFFVHAGIDPKRPLNNQRVTDMLTISDNFLSSNSIYDKIIVHGHTASKAPCLHRNRIGLDTDAYLTGALSGVMIRRDMITVIQAKSIA
jgi:serine/threonine protein phosphatase 1